MPVVFPSNIPDSISTISDSLRGVEALLCPGLRLSSSFCITEVSRDSPAGVPSTTTPRALPCDSPQVVTLKTVPKVLPDIVSKSSLLLL
ncbi:MAG: hypothetical protein A4E23_00653 [Methanomethylovorans sp. PtaU1.Bin073]|nr:MAG: hypothetical protein A4E23_00653 [Methanomethylovorans sp. PtaU1.Bin073]